MRRPRATLRRVSILPLVVWFAEWVEGPFSSNTSYYRFKRVIMFADDAIPGSFPPEFCRGKTRWRSSWVRATSRPRPSGIIRDTQSVPIQMVRGQDLGWRTKPVLFLSFWSRPVRIPGFISDAPVKAIKVDSATGVLPSRLHC